MDPVWQNRVYPYFRITIEEPDRCEGKLTTPLHYLMEFTQVKLCTRKTDKRTSVKCLFIYRSKTASIMKKLTALALLCFTGMISLAQASFTSVSYDKKNRPALMINLPYLEDVCEGFIITNLKETGYDAETKGKFFWKQNKLNGFYIFKEVQLQGLEHSVDLYFKVDERKRKEESTIYMLVGKGEGYFISNDDDKIYNAAKRFMNAFVDKAAEYKLDLDIKEQEALVKEEEKKFERLKNNENDLVKKKAQLEKDIKENQKDQEEKLRLIENEKKKLIELKAQKA